MIKKPLPVNRELAKKHLENTRTNVRFYLNSQNSISEIVAIKIVKKVCKIV